MTDIPKKIYNWAFRKYDKLKGDIFAATRAKILASYVAVGIIITTLVSYLIYRNTLSVTHDVITGIHQMIRTDNASSGTLIAQAMTNEIGAQIWKANILIGLLMFVLLGAYAYILARVTLWPIQRVMERQRRFSANVAHELRTPLSAMKASFEVALMGAGENAEGEFPDAIRSGIEEIDRMSAVTQFLLSFSSFEGRRLQLEFLDVNLSAVVGETLKRLQPVIHERDVTVRTDCPTPVWIKGNATTIGEIIVNLTKNSIAYTPSKGSICISAKMERGLPTLSVSDTGIGIPPKDLPNIFEAFYRGENAFSQRTKRRGSGIGLTIVKEIAELHKAKISVESELGKGTTISIAFPPLTNRELAQKGQSGHTEASNNPQ